MAETQRVPKEIIEHADAMVQDGKDRANLQMDLFSVYNLDWRFLPDADKTKLPKHIRPTHDPQPRNAVEWLAMIIANSEPDIKVTIPEELIKSVESATNEAQPYSDDGMDMSSSNNMMSGNSGDMTGMLGGNSGGDGSSLETPETPETPSKKKLALPDVLEGVARLAIEHDDRRRHSSLVYEQTLSGLVYGQIVTQCEDLRYRADYEKYTKASGKYMLPFARRVVNPAVVFSENDVYGLSAVTVRERRKIRVLKKQYGDAIPDDKEFADVNGECLYTEYWTREEYACWVEKILPNNEDNDTTDEVRMLRTLAYKENDLGFIPYTIQNTGGVTFFDKPEDNLSAFLYTGYKSKIFAQANLFLTVVSSLAFAMANPQLTLKSAGGDKTLDFDLSDIHTYPLQTEDKLEPLVMNISPELFNTLQIMMDKAESVTVSKIIAGMGVQGVRSAAGINLMMQSAKLSLFTVQVAVEQAIDETTEMIYRYIKYGGNQQAGSQPIEFFIESADHASVTPDMIPDMILVKTTIQPNLPTDKIPLISAATQAVNAPNPLMDKQTALEFSGFEDVDEILDRLKDEKAEKLADQLNAKQAEQQMAEQQQQQQQPPQGAPAGPGGAQNLPLEQLPAGAMPPNMMGGYPAEPNPQLPNEDLGALLGLGQAQQ